LKDPKEFANFEKRSVMELGEKENAVLQRIQEKDPGERTPRFTVRQYLDGMSIPTTDEEEMVIAHDLKENGYAHVAEAEDTTHGRYLIALTPEGEEQAKKIS
jgi:hypothetical protein